MEKKDKINIYHCCIQKSASQWFPQFFSDEIIYSVVKFKVYNPAENFVPQEKEVLEKLNDIPLNSIVSPLYIRHSTFVNMSKPENYKAFYVIRDPRDLVISDYFSLKFSHGEHHPYITEMREKLKSMSEEEGINERIINSESSYYNIIGEWATAKLDKNIKICKYEDIFGENQLETLTDLLEHLEIDLSNEQLTNLLKKYSFKNLSGRKQGEEDKNSHYRKGISGDWKNYFSKNHKDLFKDIAGQLLIDSNYENSFNW